MKIYLNLICKWYNFFYIFIWKQALRLSIIDTFWMCQPCIFGFFYNLVSNIISWSKNIMCFFFPTFSFFSLLHINLSRYSCLAFASPIITIKKYKLSICQSPTNQFSSIVFRILFAKCQFSYIFINIIFLDIKNKEFILDKDCQFLLHIWFKFYTFEFRSNSCVKFCFS